MPVDVLVETTISRTPADVAAFAADPSHAPQWYTNIRSVTWQTPPPTGIGSRMEFEAHFLGRRLVYTYEIVEFIPGQRLVMRTADGPFPMETTYTWEPSDEGTRMALATGASPAASPAWRHRSWTAPSVARRARTSPD